MLTDTARITLDGKPFWQLASGRLIPVIHGGEGPEDNTGGDAGDDANTGDDDGALGAAGVKALDAFKERARRAEAEAKKVPTLEARIAELEAAQMTDHEKAIAEARTEAAQTARAEVLASTNGRLFTAELRAATTGKLLAAAQQDLLVDNTVAMRLLGLDEVPVTATGDIDSAAIAQQVDAYLATRPHLAASATQQPGSIDQGARTTPTAKTLADKIREAEAAGKWSEAMALKTQQLAAAVQS